jgi:hypothetical protein
MRTLFCFAFLLLPLFIIAQGTDSLVQPNPYAHCGPDYNPICACDGKTYRNQCAAEQWGAILPGNWVNGPCESFDFDFLHNPVVSFDPELRVYVKNPSAVQVQIYSAFGRVVLERNYYFNSSSSTSLPLPALPNIDFKDIQKGIYILVVSSSGEKKTRKIIRLAE